MVGRRPLRVIWQDDVAKLAATYRAEWDTACDPACSGSSWFAKATACGTSSPWSNALSDPAGAANLAGVVSGRGACSRTRPSAGGQATRSLLGGSTAGTALGPGSEQGVLNGQGRLAVGCEYRRHAWLGCQLTVPRPITNSTNCVSEGYIYIMSAPLGATLMRDRRLVMP